MLRLGENVDSWCGKCKLILAHTIEAMVADKPTRVQCNTCSASHSYRPHEPGESPAETRRRAATAAEGVAPVPRGRANKYQGMLKGKDVGLAKAYSPKDNYALGDVLKHPTFGVGVAIDLRDGTKVEVLFEDGPKVLIHSR